METEKIYDTTVMVYLCGSNLESEGGSATADITEIFDQEDFRLHLYAIKDSSALDPGLNIGVEITNHTQDRHVFEIADFVLNGTRTVNSGWYNGTFMYLQVPPEETAFYIQHISYYDLIGLSSLESLSFTLQADNRSMLRKYAAKVSGRDDNRALLAADRLLERFGVSEISRITLLTSYGYHIADHVDFELEEPLDIAQADPEEDAHKMLLEGEVSAWLDRILIADNGVGIRLILQNDTDKDLYLAVNNRYLNGEEDDSSLPLGICMPAHSIRIACGMFSKAEYQGWRHSVSELALAFRLDEQTSSLAHIKFPYPAAAGIEGGIFLSPEEVETEAAVFKADIPVQAAMDPEGEAELTARIRLFFYCDGRRIDGAQDICCCVLEVTNLSQKPIHFETGRIFLNEDAVIHEFRSGDPNLAYFSGKFEPGESDRAVLTIDREVLEELGSVHSCSFVFTEDPEDARTKDIPVSLKVEGGGLENYLFNNQPLAVTLAGEHTWKLMDLKIQPYGMITAVVQADDEAAWDKFGRYQVLINCKDVEAEGSLSMPFKKRTSSERSTCRTFVAENAAGVSAYWDLSDAYPGGDRDLILDTNIAGTMGISRIDQIMLVLEPAWEGDEGLNVRYSLEKPICVPRSGVPTEHQETCRRDSAF